jgi:hypothetical protein
MTRPQRLFFEAVEPATDRVQDTAIAANTKAITARNIRTINRKLATGLSRPIPFT